MVQEYGPTGPCVCGFGEEFFTLEGDRTVCTVCGGAVGKGYVEAPEPEEEVIRSHRSILIVDDQAFFRERIRQNLKEQGHEVLEAANGLEALKAIAEIYLKRSAPMGVERLEAVILDLVMPGELDGFQTLAAVKALLPEVPVIVLTASPPKPELLQKLAKLGAKKYLNKGASNLDTLVVKNIQEI